MITLLTPYDVPAEQVVDETTVSKSRFICYLAHCDTAVLAKKFVVDIQQKHPTANHHCFAFIADRPDNSQCYGFSDDGEPSGTAGRPMLAALQGCHIGEIVAVVVRYFGGVKLGTGGLQRAYSHSVRQALMGLTLKTKVPMVQKTLVCSYGQYDNILRLVIEAGGRSLKQDFQSQVRLTVAIPASQFAAVAGQLKTLSAGQLQFEPSDRVI